MKHPTQRVRAYLTDLQERITSTVAVVDGGAFLVDHWKKPAGERLQGQGITQILEGGAVFEHGALVRLFGLTFSSA